MKWQGVPAPPTTKKHQCHFEYNILHKHKHKHKHIVYSDQVLGAVHLQLYKKDIQILKVGTIILMASHTNIFVVWGGLGCGSVV